MKQIHVAKASTYQRDTYGIALESVTRHTVTGRGVHNPSHPHELVVWDNSRRPDGGGGYLDPHNRPTEERYTFLLNARSVAIVADPRMADHTPEGDVLALGDTVEVVLEGYVLGEFVIGARPMHDPHLSPVRQVVIVGGPS